MYRRSSLYRPSSAVAGAIIAEAGLSYLGVGIGPPLPSWGNMMQGSLGNFQNAPWLVITPGIFIFMTTLGIFLFGDGLRDAHGPVDHEVASLPSGNTGPAHSCAGLSFGGRFDVEEV